MRYKLKVKQAMEQIQNLPKEAQKSLRNALFLIFRYQHTLQNKLV